MNSESEDPVLFEPRIRTQLTPARRGEGTFDFINESAWQACEAYRQVVNQWFAALPLQYRFEVVQELRGNKGNQKYPARLLELVTSALMRGLDFAVEPHPSSGTSKTPDFAICDNSGRLAGYVEVTTINASSNAVSASNREMVVHRWLDAVRMPPGYFLKYEVLSIGSSNPTVKSIQSSVQAWVDANQHLDLLRPIKNIFNFDDWSFELSLIDSGAVDKYDHAIHLEGPHTQWIGTAHNIKGRLFNKAKRYGSLGYPYLIVVGDTLDQSWGRDEIRSALSQALFGDEIVRVHLSDFQVQPSRARNGFWLNADGPSRRNVCAVLFFPDIGLWGLRNDLHKPLLAINPWAYHPIPETFLRIPHMVVENDEIVCRSGEEVADLIGLPQLWPPPKN